MVEIMRIAISLCFTDDMALLMGVGRSLHPEALMLVRLNRGRHDAEISLGGREPRSGLNCLCLWVMKIRRSLVLTLACLAVAAAQLAPPGETGVSMGHIQLNVPSHYPNVPAHYLSSSRIACFPRSLAGWRASSVSRTARAPSRLAILL